MLLFLFLFSLSLSLFAGSSIQTLCGCLRYLKTKHTSISSLNCKYLYKQQKCLNAKSTILRNIVWRVTFSVTWTKMLAEFYPVFVGWHGWLGGKAFASHQGDPGSIPGQGHICELSCALVLCCATRVFQTIQFSSLGKNRTLPILAVLRGHDVAGSQRRPCMPASQTLIIKPMKRSLCK